MQDLADAGERQKILHFDYLRLHQKHYQLLDVFKYA